MARKAEPMQTFSTIAEWIDAGNLKTGWYVVTPSRESEKAFATRCYKYSQAGNPYTTEAWFPKKLCMMVLNNFYTTMMNEDYLTLMGNSRNSLVLCMK